ncbi:MAG: Ig family protein [Parcubacteria group bacterium GW2011_GWA2_46_7]|nr:MAG: Ig family protein [Parcubacteria group bacterium GW2011_GWA2_46_7]
MKKRQLLGILGLCAILILSACVQNEKKKTANGFDYIGIEKIAGEKAPGGIITLIAAEGKAPLEITYLKPLDDRHLYEIWLFDKETNLMTSLGTFTVNSTGQATINARASQDEIKSTDAVIITQEEFPVESKEPTSDVVLRGEIGFQADEIEVKLEKPIMPADTSDSTTEELISQTTSTTSATSTAQSGEITIDSPSDSEMPKVPKPATVIIAKETEKVALSTDASDPDNDNLVYAYTSPFNAQGEWQTAYGDSGEYTVTVTVSDGELSTSEQVLVIINKKEEAPIITSFMPESLSLDGKEDSILEFSAEASDLNKDVLAYTWKIDGNDKGSGNVFQYSLGYDDAGQHEVMLVVSDGEQSSSQTWKINVENMNRKPVLDLINDIVVKETDIVKILPVASDSDNDQLTFKITDPIGENGEWQTTYESAGEYKVAVSVTDGKDTVSQDVKIVVQNVNRPPVIKGIVSK